MKSLEISKNVGGRIFLLKQKKERKKDAAKPVSRQKTQKERKIEKERQKKGRDRAAYRLCVAGKNKGNQNV